MKKRRVLGGRNLLKTLPITIALTAATILSTTPANAQSHTPPYTDLHDFGGNVTLSNGATGTDGQEPENLIVDKSGNKFIVTFYGGLYGYGCLSEFTASGTYIDLHDFGGTSVTGPNGASQADGQLPYGLLIDPNGNLFGTTAAGGTNSQSGTIWELTSGHVYKTIYNFGQQIQNTLGSTSIDGSGFSDLVMDAKGNLFGASYAGGVTESGQTQADGSVWELTSAGVFKDIHDFGQKITLANGTQGNDGVYPGQHVKLDSFGNMYGTTFYSASFSMGGKLWEITSAGQYLDLHDFGGTYRPGTSASQLDGSTASFVISDADGDLFGTTTGGGSAQAGTLWELTTTGEYAILHNFGLPITTEPLQPTDGSNPTTPIVLDASGNIYGVLNGLIWEYSGGNYFDINDFGGAIQNANGTQGPDGSSPTGIAIDSSGNLFGTMSYGGGNGRGMLYSMSTVPTFDALTLSSLPKTGGRANWEGVVRVSTPAKSNVVVSLSSNSSYVPVSSSNPGISVPPTVTIPAGATEAAFTFSPLPCTTTQTATLTASSGGVSSSATLTIAPLTLTGFTWAPGPQIGSPATGTVTLSETAPAGGVVVNLSTSYIRIDPPATVTVPAGQSSAQFPIAINALPGEPVTAFVQASYQGASFMQTITVKQLDLAGLTITPTEGIGGAVYMATVSIDGLAPSEGMDVPINTNSQFVTPPTVAHIPAGVSSGTFQVPTLAVPKSATVLLRASSWSTSEAVYFTLDPSTATPPLTNLTITPTEGVGGSQFMATVTLGGYAPTGGTVVTLATNSPFVSPPATVTVPAGNSTLTFKVPTSSVSKNAVVLLKATLGSTSKAVYFTLDPSSAPPTLTNLTVSPSEGTGGSQFMATVTLSAAAPSGGTVVALATNSPFVSPPATVTVPAGQTSYTFPVSTSAVSKSVSVLLKASLGSSVKTFYFTLDP